MRDRTSSRASRGELSPVKVTKQARRLRRVTVAKRPDNLTLVRQDVGDDPFRSRVVFYLPKTRTAAKAVPAQASPTGTAKRSASPNPEGGRRKLVW